MIETSILRNNELVIFAAYRPKDENEDKSKSRDKNLPYQVYKLKNETEGSSFKFKVIAFHCNSEDQFKEMSKYTKFKIADTYLLMRNLKE